MRERYGEAYQEAEVEDGEYEGVAGATTIGVPNLLMVNEDMDDELAYQITKALYEGKDRLADGRARGRGARPRQGPRGRSTPVELHPGAAALLRGAGRMKLLLAARARRAAR